MSEQPDTEQPDTEQPDTEQPDTEQPGTEQPDTDEPTAARPTPGPRPGPRPRPVPRPAVTTPAAATAPGPPASDPTRWGRVGEDGTVYVRTEDGDKPVGSYPGATPEEALAYFGRKYDELLAQADLLEQRLATGSDITPRDAARGVRALREALAEAHAVGDLAGLVRRVDALETLTAERRQAAEAQRAAAREEARGVRTAIVEEAERIAETDPERMQWKPAGDRLRHLFDQWKEQQRSGVRLEKPAEDELWKRFSHARTTFDRKRRAHFSQLEQRYGEAKAAKTALVAEAEALSDSTDWGATSAAYRDLMDRWKTAGRASRKDDDALWARFRAAQDRFFEARNASQAEQDARFRENLQVKERLLAEAEALLPVRDARAARAALRRIGEQWEAAGKVPRADLARVEKRMRAVEQAVQDAEQDRWRRSNPETRARATGALSQLEESIAALEADLSEATQSGDERRRAEAETALATRREWLEQVRRTADDFSG